MAPTILAAVSVFLFALGLVFDDGLMLAGLYLVGLAIFLLVVRRDTRERQAKRSEISYSTTYPEQNPPGEKRGHH